MSVYGYCPRCTAQGRTRERRPNGNDTCEQGHTYPSRDALTEPLLPCPFCGSREIDASMAVSDRIDGRPGDKVSSGCYSCGATGPERHSEVEAAAAWNKRAKSPWI